MERRRADLELPSGDPAFFERLQADLLDQERASARRWRRATAVVVGAVAAAVLATGIYASVSGGATFDRTLQCPVQLHAGVRAFSLSAEPHFGAADTDYPAGIYVETGQRQPVPCGEARAPLHAWRALARRQLPGRSIRRLPPLVPAAGPAPLPNGAARGQRRLRRVCPAPDPGREAAEVRAFATPRCETG